MITVLLATYNWPQALTLTLQSLQQQTDLDFEVVIVDDGSTFETKNMIETFRADFPVKIHHIWQADQGFRKSRILNQGIERARGDYLIFLDGDCIAQSDFIARHRALSQSGCLVTGSRILCGQRLTNAITSTSRWCGWSGWRCLVWRVCGKINKCLPVFIKVPDNHLRMYSKFVWRRIKGCDMACWKADAQAIGGFDESLEGWGHEDADFVFRLQRNGIKRKSGAFATEILHLWHPQGDRTKAEQNAKIVRAKILAKA